MKEKNGLSWPLLTDGILVLLGLGAQKTKWASALSPMRALCPVKGHAASQVMAPGDASKCHKVDKQEDFTGLCICSCRDMLRDHSTRLLTLLPKKKGQIKTPLCKQQELPIFWAPCPSIGAAFPFSLINPTLCAKLSHKSIGCLMSQFFGLWRQALSTSPHNNTKAFLQVITVTFISCSNFRT
jgi:hypothetical protein